MSDLPGTLAAITCLSMIGAVLMPFAAIAIALAISSKREQ
jgi:hypothetical protein